MSNFKRKRIIMFILLLVSIFSVSLSGPVPQAQAGIWDWMNDISELPSDFNELQSKYDQIEKNLKASQEQYENMMKQLNTENEQLRLKNDQLSERILLLEKENQLQQQRMSWIIKTALTLVGLLVFFFVVTRVMRIMVWRRSH